MMKHQQEMEIIGQKRTKYEDKHIGKYKRIFPSTNPEDQKRYEKYLDAYRSANCTVVKNSESTKKIEQRK